MNKKPQIYDSSGVNINKDTTYVDHPVTRVYSEDAFICMERDGAEPIVLGNGPEESRREALLRARAINAMHTGADRDVPLGMDGTKGLSCEEFVAQTLSAVRKSREDEETLRKEKHG